jgi:hypothetical protein
MALAVLSTAALGGGARVVVEIDEPFTLQGRICPAGVVSIRPVAQYTPTAALHEVCVANECLGVFLADRTSFASDDREDALRFERGADGGLVLVGYTSHRGRHAEFHRFSPSPNVVPELRAQAAPRLPALTIVREAENAW